MSNDPTYPLRIDTIRKALDCGHLIWVHCNSEGCWRHHQIDLVALADMLGPDHGCLAADLAPHFHCAECRQAGRADKNISFTVHPQTTEDGWARTNPSA